MVLTLFTYIRNCDEMTSQDFTEKRTVEFFELKVIHGQYLMSVIHHQWAKAEDQAC